MKKLYSSMVLMLLTFVSTITYANTPSTLVNTQCNTTLTNITSLLYCYIQSGAAEYQFEVSHGTNVQTLNVATNKFKLTDLSGGINYSTTYQIRVATRTSTGTFGNYGTTCTITTPSAPTNRLLDSFCNTNLSSINSLIYSFRDDNAQAYQFEFNDGSDVEVIERASNSIKPSDLAQVKANTTYSVRVRNKYNGVWAPYGQTCTITTPEFTVLVPTQCGQTLSSVSSLIYSYTKQNTDQYTFEVTEGNNVQTIVATSNKFSLTQLDGGAKYNTTYIIRVAIRQGGVEGDFGRPCTITTPAAPAIPLTQLTSSRCGVTLGAIDQLIYCYLVDNAQEYVFEINDGTNTVTHSATSNKFALKDVEGLAKFNTTYSIRVATKVNGQMSAFGSICTVTTPQAPSTKLLPQFCDINLQSNYEVLYCYRSLDAEGYRFEVIGGGETQVYETPVNKFRLAVLESIKYDTQYSIKAAGKYDGVWADYGEACTVKSPVRTKLVNTQCDKELNTLHQPIYCYVKPNVEQYTFEVTDEASVRYFTTTTNKFNLSDLDGVVEYEKEYEIRVAIKETDKERGGFGEMCTIKTPMKPISKLVNNWCGTTIANLDTWIYAYRFDAAEKYRFKIINDWDAQVIETDSNKFKLSDLGDVPSEWMYYVKVSVRYNGEWVDYGEVCSVVAPKQSHLVDNQCGGELSAIDGWIYAYIRPDVDAYTFEVTNGNEVRTFTTDTNKFKLSNLDGGGKFEQTYSVRVALTTGGVQGEFGKVCDIKSPAVPKTQLVVNQCDNTMSIFDETLYCDPVDIADGYRFVLKHVGYEVAIKETNVNYVKLSDMISLTPNRGYTVHVDVKYNNQYFSGGKICNVSTPTFSKIYTTQVTGGEQIKALIIDDAEEYVFEVNDGESTYIYASSVHYFYLEKDKGGGLDKDYTVRVALRRNGILEDFGPKVTLKVRSKDMYVLDTWCSKSFTTHSNSKLYAVRYGGESGYRYKFENQNISIIEERASNVLYFKNLAGILPTGGYHVSVSAKFGDFWTPFGKTCFVSFDDGSGNLNETAPIEINPTPGVSSIRLYTDYCGTTLASRDKALYTEGTIYRTDIASYVYEVTDENGGIRTLHTGSRILYLTNLVGSVGYDKEYTIRVAHFLKDGRVGGYGESCTVRTPMGTSSRPSILSESEEKSIQVSAFPNPYTDTFQISYPTDIEGAVSVSIFDMSGRQVAYSQYEAATLSEQYFGQELSAGIYNIVLEHGTEVKTLRVVKQ